MIFVRDIKLSLDKNEKDAIDSAINILQVTPPQVKFAKVSRLSVDARHGAPTLVFTVAVKLKDEGAGSKFANLAPRVVYKKESKLELQHGDNPLIYRPVICGFGPAGLFAALLLAQNGFKPIVLERGADINTRVIAIDSFYKSGILDVNTNIQFGEGGAGSFSDGKLTTRIGDDMCEMVTSTFLRHGAPPEIEYLQKPHIGTDLLRNVIVSIRKEIIALGGEVIFNTCLTDININNGKISSVIINRGEIPCNALIFAPGHSARDTFAMLWQKGIQMVAKPFSVGFRIEHLQADIDKALYHEAAGHPALPKGEYQLSQHVGDRCVYTFCMCPGGQVVAAASEQGGVVTNGMSNHERNGKNANSAVVVSVNEKDFDGSAKKAVEFQKNLEQLAYKAGGGNYNAPCQDVGSFLNNEKALNITKIEPTYPRGVTPCNIGDLFSKQLSDTLKTGLRAFDKKIKGFADKNAIITGVETRTSSPLRIVRNLQYESESLKGLYPTGEGAGYAGGIVSAAVDGLRVAKAIIEKYSPEKL